ncbi:MAG: TIGR01777 family protein [Bacteroidetes bacterium]|nr:MAG: TIGR01777 family protein [Bacteroidota bacterium]PTM09599.1 MAG: TIGR01777 family protein [Bacteroidota bacterium]
MAIVLIAGGSGLIGERLSFLLKAAGYEVRHFSRAVKPASPYPTYVWDVDKGTYDATAFEGVTHVINLAGAGIADARWTSSRKRLIIESRTASTRLLKKGIAAYGPEVKAYLAGSAIGYYGNRGDDWLPETAAPGKGFLSESVQLWEAAIAELTAELNLPTLLVRTGIVLSTQGGALPKMLLPLQVLTSTYFGDGQQWYAWIHIDDLCRIFVRGVADDTFRGCYNGVSPHPARNKTLAQALITATGKPAVLLPAPALALQFALGEMSHTVLDSARVSAQKLEASGFVFEYPELVPALQDLLERKI